MTRTHLTVLLVLAAVCRSSAQSSFSVDPLFVELSAKATNAVVTLTNPTPREIRFEIKAFSWVQGPDGRPVLSPTSDIVVFPPLVVLKPKLTQRVRIGTTAAPGTVEKAYRLMVEELPSGVAPVTANTVAIRTRVGLPVFVEPTKPSRSGEVGDVTIVQRRVSVPLRNTGTIHAMVDSVIVRGMSAPDEVAWEAQEGGWYLLAGQSRTFTHEIAPSQCAVTKAIEVEVYAHDKMIAKRADVPANGCPR